MSKRTMTRPRVTIASMLVVILASGLGFAAIRSRSALWTSACFSAFVGSLGLALLVALRGREPRRTFGLGYVVFGALYLLVGLLPGTTDEARKLLLTSQLIEWIYPKIREDLPSQDAPDMTGMKVTTQLHATPRTTHTITRSIPPPELRSRFAAYQQALNNSQSAASRLALSTFGGSFFTGDDHANFEVIGHSLLAMLLASVGGFVAVLFFARGTHEEGESANRNRSEGPWITKE